MFFKMKKKLKHIFDLEGDLEKVLFLSFFVPNM